MVPIGGTRGTIIGSNAVCALSMIVWAAGFPAADFLLQTWDPLALIAVRFALATLILVPVWMLLEGPRAFLDARWGRGTIVGGIGFGLGAYLFLLGQSVSDAVTVSIVASAMPAIGAVFEVVLDGRKLRPAFVLGIALAVLGGLVATGAVSDRGSTGLGAALALVSVVFFAWGSRAAVREFPELSTIGQTTITLGGGAIFLVLILLAALGLGWAGTVAVPVNATQVVYLVYFALGAMALSQLFWIMGVGRLGVALAAIHINAVPFYVMLLIVASGGSWNGMQALGALLVGLGVVVAQHRTRRADVI